MAYVGCYLPILSWDRDSKNLRHASHIRAAGGGAASASQRLRLRNKYGFGFATASASAYDKMLHHLAGGAHRPPPHGGGQGPTYLFQGARKVGPPILPHLPPSVLF